MHPPLRDVTVWLAWRDTPVTADQRARLVGALSDDELVRAARYRHPADADAFRWARGVQRAILARHLGTRPEALRFVQNGDEKPILDTAEGLRCEYNVSHSGSLFALAVADHAVGVDIEQARPVNRIEAMARRVFDPPVAEAILGESSDRREARFFREWTQLEAHAKLHGHGVWRILAHRERHAAAEGVRVAPFPTPPGYFGAVAVAGGDPRVAVVWWSPGADQDPPAS